MVRVGVRLILTVPVYTVVSIVNLSMVCVYGVHATQEREKVRYCVVVSHCPLVWVDTGLWLW